LPSYPNAILALADGTIFKGKAIGVEGIASGEVVFNTAMTGYQEILSDPSYCRQIVTLTYPHIGNTGTNAEDDESDAIHAAGLAIRDLPLMVSNWRSQMPLDRYLREKNVVAIAGIDTRKLTRLLREKGAQSGAIMAGTVDAREAIEAARAFPGLTGLDLARSVSTRDAYQWTGGTWTLAHGYGGEAARGAAEPQSRLRVAAYDYGIKRNILRMLAARGCDVTVYPAQTPAAAVMAASPEGVFLSNGPGDPEPCSYAIEAIREIISTDIPVFGICLGHQLMGLAAGARTMKMKFGHHGANHPVKDLDSGKVVITSQNHGFAVDPASLPEEVRATHVSLFDGSLQGLSFRSHPAFCFQGHPEASPGPQDIGYLFDRFTRLIIEKRNR